MDSTIPVVVDADVISFIFKDHQLSPASLTVSLMIESRRVRAIELRALGIGRHASPARSLQ
ncbi:MAG TPA: hypothetical protein VFC21_04370, partial [Bryobacteraceae bacterium]|nr:hypothetical protein [Bryobacteraceae bacterium]